MKDKVVLVTGANGGLGTHVTQAFLDAAATVIGSARKIQQSDFNHPNFVAIPAEISTREGAKVLVDQVVARFGKLDILVHTVGGFAGGQSIVETDDVTFQRMLDLNLNSVFSAAKAVLPHMVRARYGRIVVIASRAVVPPAGGFIAYTVAKAGAIAFTQALAQEVREHGITVNAVLPSTMDTPANRSAMPDNDRKGWVPVEAVADAIATLARPASGHITGTLLAI